MKVREIISDAIHFPIDDYKSWLTLGALYLIATLLSMSLDYINGGIGFIFGIISMIIFIMIYGYSLDIKRNTIHGINELPKLNFTKNLVDGVKTIFVTIVYTIIPLIITLIIAYPLGLYSNTYNLINAYDANYSTLVANGTSNVDAFISVISGNSTVIPSNIVSSFMSSLMITILIGIILLIIFSIFEVIGNARLAETDSISAALNLKAVIEKINNIGWGRYLSFIILLILTSIGIGIIGGVILMIPVVGSLIEALVIQSLLLIFFARSIGLIYRNDEDQNNQFNQIEQLNQIDF